ncbi:hypothetical protein C8F01DRAFT_1247986 [Mycena amicta]|nr:hypothetical protein C8F01DRAFT_1247986 [Mycena amicta]
MAEISPWLRRTKWHLHGWRHNAKEIATFMTFPDSNGEYGWLIKSGYEYFDRASGTYPWACSPNSELCGSGQWGIHQYTWAATLIPKRCHQPDQENSNALAALAQRRQTLPDRQPRVWRQLTYLSPEACQHPILAPAPRQHRASTLLAYSLQLQDDLSKHLLKGYGDLAGARQMRKMIYDRELECLTFLSTEFLDGMGSDCATMGRSKCERCEPPKVGPAVNKPRIGATSELHVLSLCSPQNVHLFRFKLHIRFQAVINARIKATSIQPLLRCPSISTPRAVVDVNVAFTQVTLATKIFEFALTLAQVVQGPASLD